jgi:hypothetical protein
MGLHFDVMFIDSFMDDVSYIRGDEVCVERMICYIPGCICYGSENFGLGSLHDDYVGLPGATPQFYSVNKKGVHKYRTTKFCMVVSNICGYSLWRSRDSVVGIATRYGLEGPGIESQWGEIFRTYPHRLQGPPSLLYNGYRVFPVGKGGRGVMLTTHPLLVPRLRKS